MIIDARIAGLTNEQLAALDGVLVRMERGGHGSRFDLGRVVAALRRATPARLETLGAVSRDAHDARTAVPLESSTGREARVESRIYELILGDPTLDLNEARARAEADPRLFDRAADLAPSPILRRRRLRATPESPTGAHRPAVAPILEPKQPTTAKPASKPPSRVTLPASTVRAIGPVWIGGE